MFIQMLHVNCIFLWIYMSVHTDIYVLDHFVLIIEECYYRKHFNLITKIKI